MIIAVAILKDTNQLIKFVFFAALVLTAMSLILFMIIIYFDDTSLRTSPIPLVLDNVTSDRNASLRNDPMFNLTLFQKTRADDRFYKLMELFDRVMTENGLTYFLYGGTLLGSYRHHGLVPWDDDLDVIVPESLKDLVRRAFVQTLQADYVVYFNLNCYWKLFSSRWDPIEGVPWKFPFLDLFFYADNETHIWDSCLDYKRYFTYAKSMIFPLRRRPYLNLSLLAPRQTKAVIAKTYSINSCQSSYFCHSLQQFRNYTEVPCSKLYSLHPFVKRTRVKGGCIETLMDKGNITRVFFDRGTHC